MLLLAFPHKTASAPTDIDAADGGDAEPLTLGIGHAEEPGQAIGGSALRHVVGLFQYRYGLVFGDRSTHAVQRQL
jgi:hypothetical protein